MATTAQDLASSSTARLGVVRVALTAALATMAFLLLCWVAAKIGLGPASHMVLELFSASATATIPALILGLCTAFVGGGIAGALFGWIFNLLAPLDSRS
jgi:hypothetical protein